MKVLDYGSGRARPEWFSVPTVLAALFLFHFAISMLYWSLSAYSEAVMFASHPTFLPRITGIIQGAVPALVLFTLSAASYWLALKGKPAAWRWIAVLAISTAAFFVTDVKFKRYQLCVTGTREYFESGGYARIYYTWWWYNDLWFR